MAVDSAMFVFEVVVCSVESYVESKHLIIRSEFGEIFSLSLKDPKMMSIIIPKPPPMPVATGKKGKKGKGKKKPKPKKGKKGKKGKKEPPPPPAPKIQAGQSVLIASTADYLIQTMKNNPLQLSLWSKEDDLVLIGTAALQWDPSYYLYLEKVMKCQDPAPVTVDETYNVFNEDTAKLMAKLGIQIKLTHLKDKVTTSFRCLSEDLNQKKYLYTGINDKLASYMCTLNTSEDAYAQKKVSEQYSKDKQISYADYKNCPGTHLPFSEEQYCCAGHATQPPDSKYRSPGTMPDIDFICDYVRKVILSCNDNMRMLTPRPTIKPRIKATDMDRLCYCRETQWPNTQLAERFKNEVQSGICALCNNEPGNKDAQRPPTLFDISNIRGPCGRADCKIANDLRGYIQNLVEEDNKEIDIGKIVGPCGSTTCTFAGKIKQFIRQEGAFKGSHNAPGLTTQCACIKTMQDELEREPSSTDECEFECAEEQDRSGDEDVRQVQQKVYSVCYFTVEYDFEKTEGSPSGSGAVSSKASTPSSPSGTSRSSFLKSGTPSCNPSKYKFCDDNCPVVQDEDIICTKKTCAIGSSKDVSDESTDESAGKCSKVKISDCGVYPVEDVNLADSDVILDFDGIKNKCCVKSCNVAEKVQDFIIDGMKRRKFKLHPDDPDPCMCDCVCTLDFTRETTYCSLCGGYEALGEDMKILPEFMIPHPCPIYHKLYDKKILKVPNPWPEEEKKEVVSAKSSKKTIPQSVQSKQPVNKPPVKKQPVTKQKQAKKVKKRREKPKEPTQVKVVEKKKTNYRYPVVPKNMGWMWTAEDQRGLKYRPGWRPGAITKMLLQRYKLMKAGGDVLEKKKQARDRTRKKAAAPEGRSTVINIKPMLIVTKKQGEYVVQMEVLKKYPENRLIHQTPYDNKPPLIYTVCRSDEEKARFIKKREKKQAKDLKRMNTFIQSTFRDRCPDICTKAYNQATGILPLPNSNQPDCPCVTKQTESGSESEEECSCSEPSEDSTTDDDEWIVQFTPPNARWISHMKSKTTCADKETQYSYLDYRVKLVDRDGKPIPRFFKGPDGRQECSDLGGFWGPNDDWLEINRDGFITPDNRWFPMKFTGPDGKMYTAEEGFFIDSSARTYQIGIDGYVDQSGKWVNYPRRLIPQTPKPASPGKTAGGASSSAGKGKGPVQPQTPTPAKKETAKPGSTMQVKPASAAQGKSGMTPQAKPGLTPPKSVGYGGKAQKVMNLEFCPQQRVPARSMIDRTGYLDTKKLNKYREIMDDLDIYDYLQELRLPCRADRASNTTRKNVSPFTLKGRLWPCSKISTLRSPQDCLSLCSSSHPTTVHNYRAQQ